MKELLLSFYLFDKRAILKKLIQNSRTPHETVGQDQIKSVTLEMSFIIIKGNSISIERQKFSPLILVRNKLTYKNRGTKVNLELNIIFKSLTVVTDFEEKDP